jgi:hypothetical protein
MSLFPAYDNEAASEKAPVEDVDVQWLRNESFAAKSSTAVTSVTGQSSAAKVII